MSERWRELQSAAENLERLANSPNIPYYEEEKLRRDASKIRDQARVMRDAYVRWLWTGQ